MYLEDVDENGEAYYVTEGKLRAGFAKLVPQEDMLPQRANIDVLPDLPYHGFKDTDYVDGIFADGTIVKLIIDLFPTSWVFKKGHRIRVSIACADWPTYDLHPKLSLSNDNSRRRGSIFCFSAIRSASSDSISWLPAASISLASLIISEGMPSREAVAMALLPPGIPTARR